MTTLHIIRDDEPLTVFLDWQSCDDQLYNVKAHTRTGLDIKLSPTEENDALEKIYSEMPSVSNYELY